MSIAQSAAAQPDGSFDVSVLTPSGPALVNIGGVESASEAMAAAESVVDAGLAGVDFGPAERNGSGGGDDDDAEQRMPRRALLFGALRIAVEAVLILAVALVLAGALAGWAWTLLEFGWELAT